MKIIEKLVVREDERKDKVTWESLRNHSEKVEMLDM